MARRAKRRPPRSTIVLRWLAVAALALIGFLYYQPVRTYLDTRSQLARRSADVRELRAERERLEARLEQSTTGAALTREARRLGFVRPGERMFIVKGIKGWRRAHTAPRDER